MKLPFTLGVIGLLYAGNAFSQINLTAANFPGPGTIAHNIDLDSTSAANLVIGTAGGNKTWDFSQLGLDDSTEYTTYYGAAAGSAYASEFPSANLVSGGSPDFSDPNNLITYMQKTSTEVQLLGSAGVDGVSKYINPLTVAKFPFTFNSTFTDIGTLEFSLDQSTFDTLEYNVNASGDAWGTIKTSIGTFNTLRVKQTQSYFFDFSGIPYNIDVTSYSFMTLEYKSPVFAYGIIESEFLGNTSTSYFANTLLDEGTATGDLADKSSLQVNPNPVQHTATADFDLNEAGQVSWVLIGSNGQIAEKNSAQCQAGKNQLKLDMQNRAAGTYFVQIISGTQIIGVQKIVKL